LQNLAVARNGLQVRITGHKTLEEFQTKAGQWRTTLLQLATREVDPRIHRDQGPKVIRIYGLDEGVREIPLPEK
ncbi:MAG: hypothetical protein ACRD7E_30460, partial [Bryobacteraceae bacterium]